MEPIKLDLMNLQGGAAIERFDGALERLIENILDPNTPAKKARSITLTVTVTPNEDRESCGIALSVSMKLAQPKDVVSSVYVGKVAGRFVAAQHDVHQIPLFQTDEPAQFPRSAEGDDK